MGDLSSILSLDFDESRKLICDATAVHNDQKLQGFFSNVGMASGDYLNFQIPQDLVVVGDIHGDIVSLEKILNRFDWKSFLESEESLLIFLGDYVDRGQYSLEVILCLCKLKCLFPKNVFLLRGNHEAFHYFPFSGFNLPTELRSKYGNKGDDLYFENIIPLFDSLYGFCEIESFALLLHGGLPAIDNYNFFDNYRFHLSDLSTRKDLFEEILWNDPRELAENNWEYSNRGVGKYFGMNITNLWLEQTHCKNVIRGHEPCKGYKTNHEGKITTIFSSKQPYPKFDSAYLKISRDEMLRESEKIIKLDNFIEII